MPAKKAPAKAAAKAAPKRTAPAGGRAPRGAPAKKAKTYEESDDDDDDDEYEETSRPAAAAVSEGSKRSFGRTRRIK